MTTPDFSRTRALARAYSQRWREDQLEFSQIDLILLMFQIGGDFEFGHLARKRNRSAAMSIAGGRYSRTAAAWRSRDDVGIEA